MVRNSRLLGKVATFAAIVFCLGALFGTVLVTVLSSYSGEPPKKMTHYDAGILLLAASGCIVVAVVLTKSMQSMLRKYL